KGELVHLGAPLVGFEGADDDAGTVVGVVQASQQVLTEAPAALSRSAGAIKAIPAVRALARQLNVDLTMVTPSGSDGVITAADVQRVAKILAEVGPPEVLRGVRRAMAQNMALAQSGVAAATVIDDADVDAWAEGTDITIRLIRAIVAGCRAAPALNAVFDSAAGARHLLKKIEVRIPVA